MRLKRRSKRWRNMLRNLMKSGRSMRKKYQKLLWSTKKELECSISRWMVRPLKQRSCRRKSRIWNRLSWRLRTCFPFLGSDAYLGSKACYKVGTDMFSNLGSDAWSKVGTYMFSNLEAGLDSSKTLVMWCIPVDPTCRHSHNQWVPFWLVFSSSSYRSGHCLLADVRADLLLPILIRDVVVVSTCS